MLSIAGVAKEVKFKTKYDVDGNQITFKGSYTFKMTDFNIDPPTAVMGTIKTGDEVTVRLEIVFTK
jgi:polyisoprenoid-binding protein YceI